MRVLHVCYSDDLGGAARATSRIVEAQRLVGIEAFLLVKVKATNSEVTFSISENAFVSKIRGGIDSLVLSRKTKNGLGGYEMFSSNLLARDLTKIVDVEQFDLINLHWINFSMISIYKLNKINQPIFWTHHDMWALTGGCHYNQVCQRFNDNCLNCPIFSKKESPASRNFLKKRTLYKGKTFYHISPSSWLRQILDSSKLISGEIVTQIFNPIDLDIFYPQNKSSAKTELGINSSNIVVGFGAINSRTNPRKGYAILKEAINLVLAENQLPEKKIVFMVFGSEPEISDNYISTGYIRGEEKLATFYSACDVFVIPSLQDNLPNTAIESLACGTPVVSFNIGGMKDLIVSRYNGILIEDRSPERLAYHILEALKSPSMAINARKFAENNFSYTKIGNEYKDFYLRYITKSKLGEKR